jgi:hypothetical protein
LYPAAAYPCNRLKFTLVIIDLFNNKPGNRLPVKATVLGSMFEVYTARTFPGIIESTDLARRLKAQGCIINVKKGHQRLDRRRTAFSNKEISPKMFLKSLPEYDCQGRQN